MLCSVPFASYENSAPLPSNFMQIKFNLVVLGVWVSNRLTYVIFQCKRSKRDCPDTTYQLGRCGTSADCCLYRRHLWWPMYYELCVLVLYGYDGLLWNEIHIHTHTLCFSPVVRSLFAAHDLYAQKHANNVDTFQVYHIEHWACLLWLLVFCTI